MLLSLKKCVFPQHFLACHCKEFCPDIYSSYSGSPCVPILQRSTLGTIRVVGNNCKGSFSCNVTNYFRCCEPHLKKLSKSQLRSWLLCCLGPGTQMFLPDPEVLAMMQLILMTVVKSRSECHPFFFSDPFLIHFPEADIALITHFFS